MVVLEGKEGGDELEGGFGLLLTILAVWKWVWMGRIEFVQRGRGSCSVCVCVNGGWFSSATHETALEEEAVDGYASLFVMDWMAVPLQRAAGCRQLRVMQQAAAMCTGHLAALWPLTYFRRLSPPYQESE